MRAGLGRERPCSMATVLRATRSGRRDAAQQSETLYAFAHRLTSVCAPAPQAQFSLAGTRWPSIDADQGERIGAWLTASTEVPNRIGNRVTLNAKSRYQPALRRQIVPKSPPGAVNLTIRWPPSRRNMVAVTHTAATRCSRVTLRPRCRQPDRKASRNGFSVPRRPVTHAQDRQ